MFSILDAWQLWQDNGMLGPAWLPERALIPLPPRDHEQDWHRRAALDAVDELLLAVELPGVADWPTVGPPNLTVGGQPQVISLGREHPRQLVFACPDQQLIVFGELVSVERTPLGPRAAISLIDMVRAGLQQLANAQPEAWAAWRLAHDHSPVVIRLIPSPHPGDGP
jgi:hypothetical protein